MDGASVCLLPLQLLRKRIPNSGNSAIIASSVEGPMRRPARKLPVCAEIEPTSHGKTDPPKPLSAKRKLVSEL